MRARHSRWSTSPLLSWGCRSVPLCRNSELRSLELMEGICTMMSHYRETLKTPNASTEADAPPAAPYMEFER